MSEKPVNLYPIIEAAKHWRRHNKSRSGKGYVVVLPLGYMTCGWVADLASPGQWAPGLFAVSTRGLVYHARGRDSNGGAERWEKLPRLVAVNKANAMKALVSIGFEFEDDWRIENAEQIGWEFGEFIEPFLDGRDPLKVPLGELLSWLIQFADKRKGGE